MKGLFFLQLNVCNIKLSNNDFIETQYELKVPGTHQSNLVIHSGIRFLIIYIMELIGL